MVQGRRDRRAALSRGSLTKCLTVQPKSTPPPTPYVASTHQPVGHREAEQLPEFTNTCSYKVAVEWIDQGSCNARCSATIDSNASYKISKVQVPWRKYECKY